MAELDEVSKRLRELLQFQPRCHKNGAQDATDP
jgi:hypothetical protein